MATKNSEAFLADALITIQAQRIESFEVIVVDKDSSDQTEEIARSFPFVRLLSQYSEGFHEAWNQGILASKGRLIGFLDSDDTYTDEGVRCLVDFLETNRKIDVVFGKTQFFSDSGLVPDGHRPELLVGAKHAEIPGSMLVRRDVFLSLGLFSNSFTMLSDLAWFAELRNSNLNVAYVEKVTLRKRLHDGSLSAAFLKSENYKHEMIAVVKHSIARNKNYIKKL